MDGIEILGAVLVLISLLIFISLMFFWHWIAGTIAIMVIMFFFGLAMLDAL